MTRPKQIEFRHGAARLRLIRADCRKIEIPPDAAIVTDPPWGVENNCDYSRLRGGGLGFQARQHFPADRWRQ